MTIEDRHRAFGAPEFGRYRLSRPIYMVARSRGLDDYIAIPVFLTQPPLGDLSARSHCLARRSARPHGGAGLFDDRGALGARMLQQEYASAHQIEWLTGGLEEPGREEPHRLHCGRDQSRQFRAINRCRR